ncbi:MAG: DNA polymerase III subunit beta, partial [Candidatus Micrarchaeota archaeon]|nr:DNA polymerase III subunit beta [Candidatus Micrarchaeota archaeon]
MTNFTVQKTDIFNALSKIMGIVEAKSVIPILSNIAFNVGDNSVEIMASDMDINASLSCAAVVKAGGDFTLPARQFYDICKKAADDMINIEIKDDRATIKSGRSRFALGTLPIDDFPKWEKESGKSFDIDAGFFLKLLDDVALSMDDDETRYYLNGVFLHEKTGNLYSVTTDGNRLSLSHGDAVGNFPEVIIPRKTVALLQKLLAAYEGDIKVLSVDNKIQITIGELVMISKVIDGKFPEYDRIVPSSYAGKFSVDTQEALRAIDRITTIEDKVQNCVRITVKNGKAVFDRFGAGEEGSDQVDAEYEGDGFVVHANSRFVYEALNKIKTGKAIIQFNDPSSPLLFTAENDDT